jgi:hypothetical protein
LLPSFGDAICSSKLKLFRIPVGIHKGIDVSIVPVLFLLK